MTKPSKHGGPSGTICAVSPIIRAMTSIDLDSHVGKIRRWVAEGMPDRWIGEQLGVTPKRITNYRTKMRMAKKPRRTLSDPGNPGTGPISSARYIPKQVRAADVA